MPRLSSGSGAGLVPRHCRELEKVAIWECRLSVRLRETYVEVQRERRAMENLQSERDELLWAWEALEGEVVGLRAQLEQGDGRAPGAEAQEARELLGRVEGAQASLAGGGRSNA